MIYVHIAAIPTVSGSQRCVRCRTEIAAKAKYAPGAFVAEDRGRVQFSRHLFTERDHDARGRGEHPCSELGRKENGDVPTANKG